MISYRRETLFDVIDEVDALLQLHYDELTLHKDKIKLDPMWERYAELEHAGSFVVFAVRDDGKLIGYSAFFVNQHMHYGQLTLAINDVLFLHPDYRSGRVGLRLIDMCEQHFFAMKSEGKEVKLVWHAKIDTALQAILKSKNYTAEETVFGKIL